MYVGVCVCVRACVRVSVCLCLCTFVVVVVLLLCCCSCCLGGGDSNCSKHVFRTPSLKSVKMLYNVARVECVCVFIIMLHNVARVVLCTQSFLIMLPG